MVKPFGEKKQKQKQRSSSYKMFHAMEKYSSHAKRKNQNTNWGILYVTVIFMCQRG